MKKQILTALTASALFLSACQLGMSADAVADDASSTMNQVVEQLNTLNQEEAQLQGLFESTLNEDQELETLANGDSAIFDNIDARQDLIESIQKEWADLMEDVEALSPEDFEESETVSPAFRDHILSINETLETYLTQYQKSLETEREYFTSLAGEGADFKTYQDGIERIQEEDAQLKALLEDLNEALAAYETAAPPPSADETAAADNGDGSTSETALAQAASNDSDQAVDYKYYMDPATFSILPQDPESDEKTVLLTFDDAPYGNALEIADSLEERGASAIFFVNGMYLLDEEGKAVCKELHDRGFEIGNHTHTHALLTSIDEASQAKEIDETNALIAEITGEKPRFFRAPHGVMTDYVINYLDELGMTWMNWSFGFDWQDEYQNAQALTEVTLNNPYLGHGANILMHDRTWTSVAVPGIVDGLLKQGFTIVDPKLIEAAAPESSGDA